MRFLKTLFSCTLAVAVWLATPTSAQVSHVDGFKPLQGVVVPQGQPSQPFKPGVVFKDCDDCPEMVVIPSGDFDMGSPTGRENLDEIPLHRVTVKSFALGKYEITQAQWRAVMGDNPSRDIGPTLPVGSLSWDDAKAFVQKLSQITGRNYRLPSESEWEYAARAGSASAYPWGATAIEMLEHASFMGSTRSVSVIGLKKSNQFGLHDMLGNVWEWVQDCRRQNYTGAPNDGRAWVEGNCSQRGLRGGAWNNTAPMLRPAYRFWDFTSSRSFNYGLRVARDVPFEPSQDQLKLQENNSLNQGRKTLREEDLKRLQVQVGDGALGEAEKASSPRASAGYAQLIAAKIKAATIMPPMTEILSNQPVEYAIDLLPDGSVRSVKLLRSGGSPAFDAAVRRAIERTAPYPPDPASGEVPASIAISSRPRDL